MIKLVVVLSSLIFVAVGSHAANDEMRIIDSLHQQVERQSGSMKIRTLQRLIEQYRTISPNKSIEFGESALQNEQFAHQPDAKAIIMRAIASSAQFGGDFEVAEHYLRKAILLCRASGNESMLGQLLTDLGNQYQRQGRFAEARAVLNEALEKAKKLSNDTIALKAHIELGNTAYDAGDIHQAMQHYRQSLSVSIRLNDSLNMARSMLNMGMANWQFDNNELAIRMLKEVVSILEQINEIHTLGIVYNNLGLIYFSERKDFDSAAFYFNASYRIREQLGSPVPLAHVIVNQANLHAATRNFDDAIALYERALELFSRAGIRSQIVRVLYHLGETWQLMGKNKTSILAFEKALVFAQKDGFSTYEELARNKLLDLYAADGNWKLFMEQFLQFRKQHTQLIDEYNMISIRENQLHDTLNALRSETDSLIRINKQFKQKIKLLESILISLVTGAGAILLIMIARRMILRFLHSH
jgi:tetratricopeptide (TPR) repeat protein